MNSILHCISMRLSWHGSRPPSDSLSDKNLTHKIAPWLAIDVVLVHSRAPTYSHHNTQMDSGGPAQTTESRGPHGGGWRNRPPVNEDWARSNAYHDSFTIRPDEGLSHALENSKANDLPPISVSAAQGKLLKLIALSINARRILEVGTLGGYVVLRPVCSQN